MSIVLQFFPNGEFSQGVDTSSNRPPKHVCKTLQTSPSGRTYTIADIQRCKEINADIPSQTYNAIGYVLESSLGIRYSIIETTEKYCVLQRVGDVSECNRIHVGVSVPRLLFLGLLFAIGSSVAPILTDSLPGRKKLLSMTRNMGRNVRNAVYLLEEKYGKEQLSFLTLTLPNLSRDGLALCCSNWDVMVNTFTKWLRTRLERRCLELEYAYCTEIQPSRLKNRGEYAPHLHIVFRGKAYRKQAWAVSWLDCRNAWAAIIGRFVRESFDTRALENIQRIKKSAARYLSKYMSKGKQTIPVCKEEESPINQLHTQWGGMSRGLSRAVKKAIIRFTDAGGMSAISFEILTSMSALIDANIVRYFSRRYISLGVCPSTGSEYGLHVGVGAFSEATHISLPLCLRFISAM